MAQNAGAQSKLSAEGREALCASYESTLGSYTYLED
jgi:hypothetical protein